MTVYEAFCGIGGFSLGFKNAGFKIVGGCEIDEAASQIYTSRFGITPERDIRETTSINGADVLCGGFPCQDISVCNLGEGISGSRSSLWKELNRIISICRPRWVILENVPALVFRGLEVVLSDLAQSGYDAEWDCLPASAFGAPHQRDRIWIVAYPDGESVRKKHIHESRRELSPFVGPSSETFWTKTKPPIFGVGHGFPGESYRCLGNAIIPQIAEWIAHRIKEIEMMEGPTK